MPLTTLTADYLLTLIPQELGISQKAMLPTLLDYLDGKDVQEPGEEEDVMLLGTMAFFGECRVVS